jgi:hypothetical protein
MRPSILYFREKHFHFNSNTSSNEIKRYKTRRLYNEIMVIKIYIPIVESLATTVKWAVNVELAQ